MNIKDKARKLGWSEEYGSATAWVEWALSPKGERSRRREVMASLDRTISVARHQGTDELVEALKAIREQFGSDIVFDGRPGYAR